MFDQRTEDILESITDEFFAVDREWRYTYINERALDRVRTLKGEELAREDLLGRIAWEMVPEVVGTVFYEKYQEAVREQKTVDFEAYSPLSDRWIEAHAYPSEEGLSVYCQDVTERKRAEEKLRESSRRVEEILESVTDAFYAMDAGWRFTYLNDRAVRFASQLAGEGFTREGLLGRTLWETLPAVVGTPLEDHYRRAVRERRTTAFEYPYPGGGPVLEVHAYPSGRGLSVYFRDVTERKRAEEEVRTRARQQAVVAELGLWALANDDLMSLMDEAVGCVARTLGVEHAKIVEVLPGGEELLLRAGVGWGEGLVGRAREDAGHGSQAGFTLLSDEPVVSDDVRAEERFRPPPLLVEHGVVGSMTVVIPGHLVPYGVLGAHAGERRVFSEDDVNFLQAVANVLAAAIERERSEEAIRELRAAERSRVGRDLHDGPLQDLAYGLAEVHVAGLDLRNDEPASAAAAFGRASSALRRVAAGLRAAVNDLRLGGERSRSLPALVESLVERDRSMDAEHTISLEVQEGFPSGLVGDTGVEVLRVVGEALTNVRRHSGARNVRVSLGLDGDFLVAEVADDGRGFGPGTAPGIGRGSMRERAEALGGALEIESAPGEGTRVRLRVPAGDASRDIPRGETGNRGEGR
jgi:PAS domain S-box-containing protein